MKGLERELLSKPGNIVRGRRVEDAKLRKAKQLRREMTPAEQAIWQRVRKNQLGGLHFRRQQVIRGFIADFYCHTAGLVVEVDGPIHDAQATTMRGVMRSSKNLA